MAETTTQINREAPGVEARKLALMQSAKDLISSRTDEVPPGYRVPGLSGMEIGAGNLLNSGVGAYGGYLAGG